MTGNEDDRADVDRRFAEIVRQLEDEARREGPGEAGHDDPVRDPERPAGPQPLGEPGPPAGREAPPGDHDAGTDHDAETDRGGHDEGLQGGEEQEGPTTGSAPPGPAPPGPAPAWRSWEGPDEEEHYVPPPPPPLPAGDLHLWGIVAGLLGGPLVLVLAHVLQVLDGAFWTWLGLALGLGGFWLLWLRLPTQRDDGPHGGAQV